MSAIGDRRLGLRIENVFVGYGTNQVLHGVSIDVPLGNRVALLGANGAGKTTLLKTISGLLRPRSGGISFAGLDLVRQPAATIVREGVVHVPEGRHVFPSLTIEENLRIAGYRRGRTLVRDGIEKAYRAFPLLAERRHELAGLLSGGQQQMLVLGRAIVAQPRLLLLDEMSLGLAPVFVKRAYAALDDFFPADTTMLVVEQNATVALHACTTVHVMRNGQIVLSGPAEAYRSDLDAVHRAYLGLQEDVLSALPSTEASSGGDRST